MRMFSLLFLVVPRRRYKPFMEGARKGGQCEAVMTFVESEFSAICELYILLDALPLR